MNRTTSLKLLGIGAGALMLSIMSSAAWATEYVASTALSKVVKASVGACKGGNSFVAPLITWGGDQATIYANGNALQTVSGSIMDQQGLNVTLKREDVFAQQVEEYMKCTSPFLRGTNGMINMAAEVTNSDPRSRMIPIYKMTWSAGGDALVVKKGIKSAKDLKGKTIAAQAYGPHVDYLAKVLSDAGLSISDVTIKWTRDLVGYEGSTPTSAFYTDTSIDAAFVIIPDALALTSNGSVGTGGEDSVLGAQILLSTKTANRIIADIYAVRADFLEQNRGVVEKFVHGLMKGQEALAIVMASKEPGVFQKTLSASADILLDSPQAVADAEGMYLDAEFVGWKGNVKFFGDAAYPRNFDKLTNEIQQSFMALGLMSSKITLEHARWDYTALSKGLTDTSGVEAPKFDKQAVAAVVARKQQQGTLSEGELFRFEVYFKPNQNTFPSTMYEDSFKRVIDMASTYGGALITIEGHSDPLGYLKQQKKGESQIVLKRTRQSARNLSITRANAVRDSIVGFATGEGVTLDVTQFAIVGHGFESPSSGMCGQNPCAPKTEQEWLNNMRVVFRIIQVEAESSVFSPL